MATEENQDQLERLSLQVATTRLGRRSLLKVAGLTAGTGLLGGLLAACGSDDDDDPEPTATTATEPDDTEEEDAGADAEPDDADAEEPDDAEADATETDEEDSEPADTGDAQTGGTFVSYSPEDPDGLDFHGSSSQAQSEFAAFTHSRLFMVAAGPDIPRGSLDTQPDAAESVEIAEDGITYRVTLRDDVMFHPPLDRPMDAEDVVYTFRYLAGEVGSGGIGVGEESNRLDRLRIVDTIEAVDERTVEFVLKEPHPFFVSILAEPKVMFIHPKEAENDFNPAEEVIGSGPWILDEYRPNTVAIFRRHEKWHHGPERPYMDNAELNIIPQYATRLSQFMGGNLDWAIVEGADLGRILDAVPDAQVYQMPEYPLSVLNFSPQDEQWQDVRYRQAVSMALNRDEMLEAAYGLKQLEEETGIEIARNWHTWLPIGFSEFWADPKTVMDPDSAKFLTYDPEGAKALIEEAGGGFATELHYTTPDLYGEPYRIICELTVTYLNAVGFECLAVEEDYSSQFIPNTNQGQFNGMMVIQQTRLDPFAYFQTQYLNANHGLYAQWSGDEEIVERLEHIRQLTDFQEIREEVLDIQNLLAQKMYVVPMQDGAAPKFRVYQPWVKNALDYQSLAEGDATELLPHIWLDR